MVELPGKRQTNFALIGIISILLFLFLCSLLGSSPMLKLFGVPKINATILFLTRMLYWIALLLLWLYSTKIEKQHLLIWEDRKLNFLTYTLTIIILFVALFVGLIFIKVILSLTQLSKTSPKLLEIVNIFRQNKFLMVFTALTAGVTEELIMRGYLQPRLEIIFKNPYWAIIISSVLFGLLHYGYGTAINIIGPIFIGGVFAFYYWKFRNIKVLIIVHFLWDLLSLFILLRNKH